MIDLRVITYQTQLFDCTKSYIAVVWMHVGRMGSWLHVEYFVKTSIKLHGRRQRLIRVFDRFGVELSVFLPYAGSVKT